MAAAIYGINGPVVYVKGCDDLKMMDMVKVGKDGLIGEVIGVKKDLTVVQCYESTTGLLPGEEVVSTNHPMSACLAPGLIGNIFDGILRPLKTISDKGGIFIDRGVNADSVDLNKKWETQILVKKGDKITPLQIVALVKETKSIVHKIMAPDITGTVKSVTENGMYSVSEVLMEIEDEKGKIHSVTLMTDWPIRVPRPYKKRLPMNIPLVTGQRIIDSFFPIAKGGTVAIPGGFGTGKTMTQHQLAKWSDADIIVYIGCGERGNEMTQVLEDFSKLSDPKTGNKLMDRTILIANTSNMPVAAREACIYTGITIAEYFRDMGYNVAIMADSTSRWAEALREISGRLEEMPAEEGFPAYLPSRISGFYERAGYMESLNGLKGSVSIIGAVSPQGDDFSEPVTQNTKRFVRVFLNLDRQLAYARHFPAIHWMGSYSEYLDDLKDWFTENVNENFTDYRARILNILNQESKLMEIVKLIGADVLPDDQKVTLDIAKLIRIGVLQQNAFNELDTYVPLWRQFEMMRVVLHLADRAKELVSLKIPESEIKNTGLFEKLAVMKYDKENVNKEHFDDYIREIDEAADKLKAESSKFVSEN